MGFRNRIIDSLSDLRKALDGADLAIQSPAPDIQETWYRLVDILSEVQYSMGELLSDGYPTSPRGGHTYCYHCGKRLDRMGPRDCPVCKNKHEKLREGEEP